MIVIIVVMLLLVVVIRDSDNVNAVVAVDNNTIGGDIETVETETLVVTDMLVVNRS
jgi:hypothetical protein